MATAGSAARPFARTPALRRAVISWATVAIVGQLLFAGYILGLYGRGALRADPTVLDTVMPKGHVPGDTVGNAVIVAHLAFAVVLLLGGALQLVPAVRRRAPRVHRWTGRLYVVTAIAAAIGGLYLVWIRGAVGDRGQHLGSTLNALVIVACGVMAIREARARAFATHRQWAIRLWLAAGGVWFFRIGLILWILAWRRPVGFDGRAFVGPFLTTLAFGETLIPLLIAELTFRCENAGATPQRWLAAMIGLCTVVTAAGLAGVVAVLWLPRLR